MVPQLEDQIDTLLGENDTLRRRIREAEEHSDAGTLTVDHLRALVAERDTRIAELRAQA
jgi:regulator of replication initiation timing